MIDDTGGISIDVDVIILLGNHDVSQVEDIIRQFGRS